jgi:hypothetical protein
MRAALLFLLMAGCPGGGGQEDAGPPLDESAITCRTDPLAENFNAGMKKTGTKGMFTFVLESSDPSPPARGTDTWIVRVEQNGMPQAGAMLNIVPFMPRHGHGTSLVPVATPMGDGYSIAPLYFFMPGLWRVTITATVGAITDSADFVFCIEG